MKRKMKIFVFWGVFFLVSGGWETAVSEAASVSSQEENIYRVLYLNSYHRGHLWSDGIEQGLREGLRASGKQVNLYVESLDTQRFPEGKHLPELARTLAVKHRRIRYDVIAASDNNAFDFALQYRSRLFPDAPLVFCGYNSFRPEALTGIANVTGINEEADFTGAIDMALSIHPKTKTLVFVTSDYYSSGQRNQAYAEAVLIPAYRDQYEVIQLKNLYLRELEQRLAELPPHALVFVLGGPQDNRDQEFIPSSDYYRRIAAASTAPAYSFWDFTLNTGIMGGSIITGIEQGRMVADITLKILDGVRADAIPVVMSTPTSTIFDFHALRRFGVSERLLPKGSIVLNRPETFYQKYKRYVLISVFAFITLLTLAASLAYLLRQSRRLETALRQHREHLQEEVAERTAELRQTHDALQEREALFHSMFNKHSAVMLLIDPATGHILDANQAAVTYYGYSLAELQSMSIYAINQLDQAAVAHQMAQAKSQRRNYFEFRHRLADGEIRDVEVHSTPIQRQRQTILFSIIHDVTERKQAEEALRESEARFRNIFEYSGAGIALSDLQGKILQINPTFFAMLGYTEEELVGQTFQLISHPDDIAEETKHILQVIKGEFVWHQMEKRYIHKDGQTIWGLMTISVIRDAAGAPVSVVGQVQDVTRQKRIEAALRESEKRYRLLAENATDVIWILDLQGRFMYVSPSVERLRGYTPEEAMQQTIADSVTPEFLQSVLEGLHDAQEAVKAGKKRLDQPYRHELQQPCKDGRVIWTESVTTRMYNEHGEFEGILGVTRDISERKQAEEALARSNRLLEAIIKQAPFAAHVLEGDRNHIHVILENDESKRIMGEMLEGRQDIDANRPETLGSRFFSVDGAQEIPLAQMPSPRAFQGEIVRNEEFLFRHPDDTEILVEANASPVYDDAQRIIAIVVTFHDITERKRIEETLRESEEKYRMLIEYSNDVIWTLDLNGNFTYISPSVFRLRGFTPEEVMRQPIEEAICPGSLPAVQAGFRLAFETIASGQDNNPPEYFEIEQPRRDGTTVWTEATARLMYNAADQPMGLVGVSRDISERKRMEAEILRTKEQAENAERLKSTFFANVSHHLRTPLNVILGFADLMAEDPTLSPTFQEYLALMRQNGKELLTLINRMLTVSKLQPEDIANDEASYELLSVLENSTPQTTLTRQTETSLREHDVETLQRRVQELPEEIRNRLLGATQSLDIELMSQIIEQMRPAQPATADILEGLTRNFEYERILALLREKHEQ